MSVDINREIASVRGSDLPVRQYLAGALRKLQEELVAQAKTISALQTPTTTATTTTTPATVTPAAPAQGPVLPSIFGGNAISVSGPSSGPTVSANPATTGSEGVVTLAGDLGGTADLPKVVGIQGVPVSATAPTDLQVLQYINADGMWEPKTISTTGIGGVNSQVGTTYTIIASDNGKLVTFNNASPVAVTITAAATLGSTFVCLVENRGAGAVTLTPATGTIDGAASLAFTQNQGIVLYSDGANFFTERGIGGSGSFTAGGDLSGTSSSQTVIGLEGKPLDATTVGSPSNGNVITYDSVSGKYKALAPSGGSGALTLLEQHTISTSTAAMNFTSCITATYDTYLIELLYMVPVTNGDILWMRVSTDGGTTWVSTSSYNYQVWQYQTGFNTIIGSTSDTKIQLAGGVSSTAANGGMSATLKLFDPLNASHYKSVFLLQSYRPISSDGNPYAAQGGASYLATTAVNAFQFIFSTGNIASGVGRCYGLSK